MDRRTPPAGRYDRRRPLGRALTVTVVVVALAAVTLGLALVGWRQLTAPVRWQNVGYTLHGPQLVEATFDVTKDPGATARCQVAALALDGGQVGVVNVEVPPAREATVRTVTPVRTQQEATTAVVTDCRIVTDP